MSGTHEDDLKYQGPNAHYTAPLGGFTQSDTPTSPFDNGPTGTYARLDYIHSLINLVAGQCDLLLAGLEQTLNNFALPVTTDLADTQLQNAHAVEWPADLGPPKSTITYQYYKMLGFKTTKSAQYIRSRYEEAVRGETGTNAIDLLPIVQLIRAEVTQVQSYVDTFIGSMDDTAEYRSTELVQDWLESARNWTGSIQQIFASPGTTPLPDSEIAQATATNATQAQAIFKVKLNVLNDQITRSLQTLQMTFANFTDLFYNQVLGPAMNMRLGVNRKVEPKTSRIGNETWRAAGSMDSNLAIAHGDQLRRNRIFAQKMEDLLTLINARDTYRVYIAQLATQGKPVPSGISGTTINDTATDSETAAFQTAIQSATTTTANQYQSSHNDLSGRDDPTGHPWALDKTGDTITGNISVSDGVTIDGVNLSTHAHTGTDGSTKIDGSSIVPGTLDVNAVSPTATPTPPINLQLVRQTARVLPTGLTVVDIDLSWDGDSNLTFEINVAPLPS